MDKKSLKQELYDACLTLQTKKIRQIEETMAEAQQSADEDDQSKDMYDATRMLILNKRDMYGQQLAIELDQLETLHKLDCKIDHTVVEFGAVAITDDQKVFVAIGLGKVQVGDESYFVISPKVPFFQSIRGLKKGSTYDFRGKKNKILDVF